MTVNLPRIRITKVEFDALPEYSRTVPTGLFVGKKWKSLHYWFGLDDVRVERWILLEVVSSVEVTSGRYRYKIASFFPVIRVPAVTDACRHARAVDGKYDGSVYPRYPLVYGSAQVEICPDCGAWRLVGRGTSERWRPGPYASAYSLAVRENMD